MPDQFDPYYKWLGIRPEEQPPHHYRLLAISPFESDLDVISSAADQRMAHVKAHHIGKHAELSQRLLNELSTARVCLLNPSSKACYDAELQQRLKPAPVAPPPDPAIAPIQIAQAQVRSVRVPEQDSKSKRIELAARSTAGASRRHQAWNYTSLALPLAGIAAIIIACAVVYLELQGRGQQIARPGDDSVTISQNASPASSDEATSPSMETPAANESPTHSPPSPITAEPAAAEPEPPKVDAKSKPPKSSRDVAQKPTEAAPANPPAAADTDVDPQSPPSQPRPNDVPPTDPPIVSPAPAIDARTLSQEVQAEYDRAKSPADFGSVARHALKVIELAITEADPTIAERVGSLALLAARKCDDKALTNTVTLTIVKAQEAARTSKQDSGK